MKETLLTKNIIALRNNLIIDSGDNSHENQNLALQVAAEMMQFGYLISNTGLNLLSRWSKDELVNYHNEVINYLKTQLSANRQYVPFWKGFPDEVMEKSETELWLHQIFHYWSGGKYEPSEWTEQRKTAFEHTTYTKLLVGSEYDFDKIFTTLVSVNQSLTPDDLQIVKWFVKSGRQLIFPDAIPFKENLTTLASLKLDVPVKTVTDVLRIAVGMSGGDVSLPKVPNKYYRANKWSSALSPNPDREKFKFAKFSRADRKYILSLLEKTNCDASEGVLKDERWKRLGEVLHPGEFRLRFPRANTFFDNVRNGWVKSWYSKLQKEFSNSLNSGLDVLSERPGEFARKLDWMLRSYDANVILDKFQTLGEKVSNKVLFELFNHFENRTQQKDRFISVKSSRRRTKLTPLIPLDENLILNIQENIRSILSKKFEKLDPMGKVWLDEKLKNIPLPTNMRSLSSGLKPKIRGTATPIGNQDAKVLRGFVHWFDQHGILDIDLTATFFGDGLSTERIGWNGRHNDLIGCYSGDVRHRKGACAEYIDISIDNALKQGYEFVVLDARNYNGGSFSSVPECVVGFMVRSEPATNEIFVPSTIDGCTALNNESSTTLIGILNLKTQEFIFLDIDMDGIPVASANTNKILETIKPYTDPPKFSVYDLLKIHVDSRGILVDNVDDADINFKFDDFSASYVKILEFMGI